MRRLIPCTVLLGSLCFSSVCPAQETAAPAAVTETALSPVAKALSDFTPVCGSFNKDADYFIYLYSASWCGPCRQIMPQIVQLYKDRLSKEKRIEIVLFNVDRTAEAAKKYVQHYNADFYTVWSRDDSRVDNLPGAYQVRSIPHCIAVDKNGNRIFAGHAATLFRNLDKLP